MAFFYNKLFAPPARADNLQSITESLYKQNLEIVAANKVLSLLSKLYEISMLTLDPTELALRISQTIRTDFDFEFVALLQYDQPADRLTPLTIATAKRFDSGRGTFFKAGGISNASASPVFKDVIAKRTMGYSERLADLWGAAVTPARLKKITAAGTVAASLAYPLVIEKKVIGIFVIGLNRTYEKLVSHEKEAIKNCANVIAVALDKALVYERLQAANSQLETANKQLKEANEELRTLDDAKSEFISIASHQLRTPLTAIKGYGSMLLEGTFGAITSAQQLDAIKKMFISSARLTTLVENLLNVSRIESGRITFAFNPVQLEEVVADTVATLVNSAQENGLYLTMEKPAQPLPAIDLDEEKIRQVIINYVDNAIKYTRKGGVRVEVGRQGDSLVCCVHDTGIGISKEEQEKLFQKFSRGKNAFTINSTGNGLGLYVAHMMVAGHNGKTWVESAGKGKGSSFCFSLPLRQKGWKAGA